MVRIIKIISIIALSITNSIAEVVNYSKLSSSEKEFIISNLDDDLIKYDVENDMVILDKELNAVLIKSGILSTETAAKSSICGGDEG